MSSRTVDIFGAPLDLGGNRRGTDMGPSAIRIAGLAEKVERLGNRVKDHGNLKVASVEDADPGDPRARFLGSILAACEELARSVERSLGRGHLPLVLGGDHSIAIGSVAGVAGHFREQGQEIGLIWVDAHADMNTPETSPSGNVHGMPLAVCLGWGPSELTEVLGFAPKVHPDRVALIGIRDLDRRERDLVAESGVAVFTMKDIDRYGMSDVAERALKVVADGTAGFHLSVDLDGVDPEIAPGVGTPVAGGLSYREAHLLMELVADTGRLTSLELVEHNPILDTRNRTAELGVGLVLSALGRRIL